MWKWQSGETTTRSKFHRRKKCAQCKEERTSRRLVAKGPDDSRFHEAKFTPAPAIFPNNDIKYDINKQRARVHAARVGEAITWVQAKDSPSHDALRERPNITAEKKKWLNFHDKDCGALYGMLPLIQDMPVAS